MIACGDSDSDDDHDDQDATSDVSLDAGDVVQGDAAADGSGDEDATSDVGPDVETDIEVTDTDEADADTEPDAEVVDGQTVTEAACRQIAEANCAALFDPACDCRADLRRGYADEAACVRERAEEECYFTTEFIVAGIDAGTIRLLQSNVDACVAGIEAQTEDCRFDSQRGAAECQMVLVDAAALGETCSIDPGVSCAEGAGVCQPDTMLCDTAPADGEPCVGPSCALGLYCENGICSAPREEGGSCETDTVCPLGFVCRDGTCQGRLEAGQDCIVSTECAFGSSCDGGVCVVGDAVDAPCDNNESCGQGFICAENFGARTCGVGAQVDEFCSLAFPCAAGLYCESGLCAALGVAGAGCGSSADCTEGLVCYNGECTALPAEGENCLQDADAFCARGLGCDFGSGKCAVGQGDGEICLINGLFGYVCGDGLTCSFETDGSFCRPGAGLGDPCSNEAMCGPERYCDYNTSTCANRLGVGEPCPFGGECQDGLACDSRFGEMVCVVPPESGEACNNACAGELVCSGIGGLCAPSVCGI